MKTFTLLFMPLLTVGVAGCLGVLPPPEPPTPSVNLYQPPSTCSSEIEYSWENPEGEQRSFFPGNGGFCETLPDKVSGTNIKARCAERDNFGNLVRVGDWVESRMVDLEEILELCSSLG